MVGSEYTGNGQYGIHLSCSQNGTIDTNTISGHLQSAVWIGNHDNGTVSNCRVSGNGIGVEVENSAHINIENSQITGNSAGIVISAQPDMPMPATRDISIGNNTVARNNRPLPEAGRTGIFSVVPVGTGILNLGGDQVIIGRNIGGDHPVIRQNRVLRNDTLGIGIVSNPFVASDLRVDPVPDNNQVRDNRSLQNAGMPDPQRGTIPSADIGYDSSGTGNCFADNLVITIFPDTLTSGFPCP